MLTESYVNNVTGTKSVYFLFKLSTIGTCDLLVYSLGNVPILFSTFCFKHDPSEIQQKYVNHGITMVDSPIYVFKVF